MRKPASFSRMNTFFLVDVSMEELCLTVDCRNTGWCFHWHAILAMSMSHALALEVCRFSKTKLCYFGSYYGQISVFMHV